MNLPSFTNSNALSHLSAKQAVMELFQSTGQVARNRSSNTVSFYDIMPKYARTGNEAIVVTDANETTRNYFFVVDGEAYVSEVEAAKIRNPKTNEIEYHFPATKEELIEDVLRHLLTSARQMTFFEDNVGLQFTIYNIAEELKKYKKQKNNVQIRLSLRVLRRARLSVFRAIDYNNGLGEPLFEGPFFSDATVIDLNAYFKRGELGDDHQIKGMVKFHNMITLGIAQMDFRLLRYDIIMSYSAEMARWLHKRISHRHRMKNSGIPYEIKLSTIFNDGNWKWLSRLDKCRSKCEAALQEMFDLNQLRPEQPWDFIPIVDPQGKKIDYLVKIYLSREFIDHISHVDDIHTEFKKKQGPDTSTISLDSPYRPGYVLLVNHHVRDYEAEKIARMYSLRDIESAISYSLAVQHRKSGKGYFNLGGYINRCLEEGWHKNKEDVSNAPKALKPAKSVEPPEAITEMNAIDISQYSGMKRQFVSEIICKMSPASQARFQIFGVKSDEFSSLWQDFQNAMPNLLDDEFD